MGCLSLFINFLIPGLGTILFTDRKVQGFIQIVISIVNDILIIFTLGIWGIVGIFIHLGLFIWAIASSISFMSEQASKKAVQQERNQ